MFQGRCNQGLTIACQELSQITDQHVASDLHGADRRAGHWLDEDPPLDRLLAWIRLQPQA